MLSQPFHNTDVLVVEVHFVFFLWKHDLARSAFLQCCSSPALAYRMLRIQACVCYAQLGPENQRGCCRTFFSLVLTFLVVLFQKGHVFDDTTFKSCSGLFLVSLCHTSFNKLSVWRQSEVSSLLLPTKPRLTDLSSEIFFLSKCEDYLCWMLIFLIISISSVSLDNPL